MFTESVFCRVCPFEHAAESTTHDVIIKKPKLELHTFVVDGHVPTKTFIIARDRFRVAE